MTSTFRPDARRLWLTFWVIIAVWAGLGCLAAGVLAIREGSQGGALLCLAGTILLPLVVIFIHRWGGRWLFGEDQNREKGKNA